MKTIILVLIAVSPLGAGDCIDAVNRTIGAASRMNESWFSTCKTVATDDVGRNLCNTVHSAFSKALTK